MNDIADTPEDNADAEPEQSAVKGEGWSTGAKAGAAVGSAALVAALLYAGRQYAKRQEKKDAAPKILPEGFETD